METFAITPEMLTNAPARVSTRGRQKGTSPVALKFRDWYGNGSDAEGFKLTNSEYSGLRLAVCRAAGIESNKVSDYNRAMESLGIGEVFLGQTGQGTDRVLSVAIVRHDGSDANTDEETDANTDAN